MDYFFRIHLEATYLKYNGMLFWVNDNISAINPNNYLT
jgi:hypothetical protein